MQRSQLWPKTGVLGAGQLATMLAEAARKLGFEPSVYSGNLEDGHALRQFFEGATVVVFENEFVDCEHLKLVARAQTAFFPSLDVISQFQDKLNQKKILNRLGIPTAAFVLSVADAKQRFGSEFVLKWSRMGYDGKGVLFVDASTAVGKIHKFLDEALDRGAAVYAEPRVPFRRELAVVASLSTRGEFAAYPLVVSEQQSGICKRVYGPATSFGVSSTTEKLVHEYAEKLARATGLVGTFALELFETFDGGVLVNEIAPRVHNSGHYSQDACNVSQFENHWRAILGLPLVLPKCAPVFAMRNLLGPENVMLVDDQGRAAQQARLVCAGEVRLHWYDKKEIKPKRKLGHFNLAGTDITKLETMLECLDQCHVDWENSLKELTNE